MLVGQLVRLFGLDVDVTAQLTMLFTSHYTEEIRLLQLIFKHFKSNKEIRKLNKTAMTPTKPPVERIQGLFPPTSSAKVKERVELYLCSTCGPSWPLLW